MSDKIVFANCRKGVILKLSFLAGYFETKLNERKSLIATSKT